MWQIHAIPRYRRPSCTMYIQWTQNWNLRILKGILWSSGLTCVGYHALRNAKAIQFSESTKVGGRNLSWAPPLPGASQISTHGCLKQNNIWPYMDSQSCIHLYGCCFIHPRNLVLGPTQWALINARIYMWNSSSEIPYMWTLQHIYAWSIIIDSHQLLSQPWPISA